MDKTIKINGCEFTLSKTKHGESITDNENNITYCERNTSERQKFIKLRRLFDNQLTVKQHPKTIINGVSIII